MELFRPKGNSNRRKNGGDFINDFSLFDLTGMVSIITGGGDGLGRIMATGLAEAGCNIVLCSRSLEKCETPAHEFEQLRVKVLAIQM